MKTKLLSIAVLMAVALNVSAQKDSLKLKKDSVVRSLPSPIDSPPFPGSEWIGPVIGTSTEAPLYPLQKALGLTKGHLRIYGWIDASANISSSKHSNAPAAYDISPNTVSLDQAIIKIEKQPNTVQTDHFDYGFLFTSIFGTNYRYTTSKGYFSDQLLKHNNRYGYDPAEIYGLLYFPKVADGLVLKIGRFISPADIEAQWAPDNYLYTHSLMFTVDPYTFTGVHATLKLGSHWHLYGGVHTGNDMAPWSNSASINGLLMARWVSDDNNNSLYGGINSLGAGKYKNNHDNLQMAVATWGHRFSGSVHMMTEVYYMWQKDALTGGSVIDGPPKDFYTGVGPGNLIPGTAKAVGAVNYFQIKFSAKDYLSIRNGYLNDPQANRTGYATKYSDHTIGFVHHFNSLLMVRPEIRYERAYADGVLPYDNGLKKDQYSAAMDVIMRF